MPVSRTLPTALSLLISASISAVPASAQVNTEAMRGDGGTPGLHSSLEGHFTWVSGNAEFVKTNGLARADYVRDRYHGFLVGNYELGRQDDETFIRNGFAHFRNVVGLLPRTALELFAQLEFNEFLMLQQRRLLGAGLRYNLGASAGDAGASGSTAQDVGTVAQTAGTASEGGGLPDPGPGGIGNQALPKPVPGNGGQGPL